MFLSVILRMFSLFYHLQSLEILLFGANACLAETADILLLSHNSISNWWWIFYYFTVWCGVCEQPQVYLLHMIRWWSYLLVRVHVAFFVASSLSFLLCDNDFIWFPDLSFIWFADLLKILKLLAVLFSLFLEAVISVVTPIMLLAVLGVASGFVGFILERYWASWLRSYQLLKKFSA
jgi:hypothetical protein